MAERSVEVINQAKDSYGTGCLLAPGLVLTACHVAKPGGGSTVKVKHGRGTAFTEATVVWKNTALDAVLLKADPGLVGSGMQAVRFGELVCDYPAGRPVCTMTGFPRAMRRRISPDRQVDDPKTVDGYVAPHTGSHSQVYGIEVARALPTQVMDWQGMSGSGLFCSEMLIGLVRSVPTKWQGVLLALPVSQLLAAEGFSEAVTAATGLPPSLAPADLAPLLDRTPLPRLSSSYLLAPRARTVGLTGIQSLTDQLAHWCQEPEPVDFAAVTGLGGTGKTRLVTEVLNRLSHTPRGEEGPQPWSGGFLAETPEQTAYGMLASGIRPLLIAIDLADTRLSQIREVMATMAARSHGAKMRILLLARGHDHWWPALSRHVRALRLGPASRTFRITPADALTGDGPEDVYVQAKADFARRIRLLQKLGHAHGAWQHAVVADAPRRHGQAIESADRQPVIYHHIAALADLLAHASPDLAQRDHPLGPVWCCDQSAGGRRSLIQIIDARRWRPAR